MNSDIAGRQLCVEIMRLFRERGHEVVISGKIDTKDHFGFKFSATDEVTKEVFEEVLREAADNLGCPLPDRWGRSS